MAKVIASFDISKAGIHQRRMGYLDERNAAVAWAKDAAEYLKAANILADSARDAENEAAEALALFRLTSPFYFLLCQSIELALKAYLVGMGADDGKLKKIGHSLAKAKRACEAEGYAFSDDFAGLIEQFGPFHEAHTFRYYANGLLQIPLPIPTLKIVEAGVSAIVAETHASVLRRLNPLRNL